MQQAGRDCFPADPGHFTVDDETQRRRPTTNPGAGRQAFTPAVEGDEVLLARHQRDAGGNDFSDLHRSVRYSGVQKGVHVVEDASSWSPPARGGLVAAQGGVGDVVHLWR